MKYKAGDLIEDLESDDFYILQEAENEDWDGKVCLTWYALSTRNGNPVWLTEDAMNKYMRKVSSHA